jgi:hypothetical protein
MSPNAFVWDSAFDLSGHLFIYGGRASIYEYYDPIHEWQTPNAVLTLTPEEDSFWPPLAFEHGTNTLYFGAYTHSFRAPPFDIAARTFTHLAPHDRITYTRNCNDQGEIGNADGLAVNRSYIIVSCTMSNQTFVYPNRKGRQDLVETLPGGNGLLLWP